MKQVLITIIVLFSLVSCNKSDDVLEKEIIKPAVKKIEFGFKYSDFNVVQDTIKKGDTFGTIIENQNIGNKKVYDIIKKVKDTFDVRIIRINKPYTLLRSKNKTNKLQVFVYQPDAMNYYVVDLRDTAVVVYKKTKPITIKTRTIGGLLKGSLSETLEGANVEGALASKISKIYAWSIDFFKLKKGDRFAITFTERYINDTIYDGVDSLKAAFFEYKGKIIYAFPYAQNPSSNKIEYYDEEGKTLKNFFLKTPIKFSRISSRFSTNRFHPVQQRWKAHKGTDYAAPYGTPITTTAAGTIEQTGFTAGNGNFVKVKHNGTYSTQYLHMSRILVRRGQHVNQGQVIGRVGSTGLATGPHVCYRFWKNGVQVDALRLKLPNGEPMSGRNKDQFLKVITPLKWQLDSVSNL
ncbi:peptidoglycan DD-metalloendopeptidase family protein [Flavobacterium gawalongense]|uniref:Peptidoglycan DD-metalloendopeptidase family protein n=1 Tax=Flavobacterium gawalongense TaxID=2594432 RepID=A0A553BTU9_9FLAO|nr:peptidoglycan DD-metalloendopeptidase family protein [Flavobacterium gawalongense]TRX02283.1 peptidoglycan DD-metalloendopeptidase family protein [Flavobacterium gawalongense]TRX07511.1 peptidoglycan DD-metalloendopeptidase family protein [Flavobacterium gawalongense]TRX11684.1 peptidoglycan DD-metalloendopeptidase family protein [Flavobacterium gawalongense]TRX12450.1 peptidoglycan DD-metalloendopeptidase family protein [Flavobacterium gawalongense]TRX30422.1 peptidoglycan DD-metalloendope